MTVTAQDRRRRSGPADDSHYGRVWAGAASLVAAVWIAVAVTDSPPGALTLLVLAVSLYGGLLVVRSPWTSASTLRRVVTAILGTAAGVVVVVGIGHHVVAGLATVVALAVTSPAVLRRVAARHEGGQDRGGR